MTPAAPGRPGPAGYHHGDLRRTLLDAAALEIRRVGVAGLRLRELARRAGVSHAAPAHHFGDKTGLLTALATEGYLLLHQETSTTLGGADALVRAGIVYVRFAVAHPGHFAVMFDATAVRATDLDFARERDVAFGVLFQAVRDSTGASDDAVLADQATAAWIIVHGAATLWLAGNLPWKPDPANVEPVFRQIGPALQAVAEVSAAQLRQMPG